MNFSGLQVPRLTMRGAVYFLPFLSKNALFQSILTEYFSDLPLFVLTENSLHAEVVEHHPVHLGLTFQAPKYF